ncbi:MAG: DapH/DapD/GlmU-related protein [Desulfovibrionaceae bacterium]
MREYLQKARARGISVPNILSYVCIKGSAWLSGWWGLSRLRLKARVFGIEMGKNVRCAGPVILARWPGSQIRIGAACSLISTSQRATAGTIFAPVRLRTHGPDAKIILEEGVELSGTSITARSQHIHVGKYVLFAPNCCIVDSDFHAHWPPERRHLDPGYERDAPVTIGDHVWLGLGVIILKGVTIGEGAIIAAGSVVTRDIPPRTLAAGSPAKVVKNLP